MTCSPCRHGDPDLDLTGREGMDGWLAGAPPQKKHGRPERKEGHAPPVDGRGDRMSALGTGGTPVCECRGDPSVGCLYWLSLVNSSVVSVSLTLELWPPHWLTSSHTTQASAFLPVTTTTGPKRRPAPRSTSVERAAQRWLITRTDFNTTKHGPLHTVSESEGSHKFRALSGFPLV